MLLPIFLRYQLRNRQAYSFLFILLLFAIRTGGNNGGGVSPFVFGLIYMPILFTNLISLCGVPLPLIYISNTTMVPIVRAYNLSVLCWLNIVAGAINIFSAVRLQVPVLTCIENTLILNILIFLAFIVGNRLSFSDLFTLKSRFWGFFAINFIFIVAIVPVAIGLSLLKKFWNGSIYVFVILIPILILLWWYDSGRYKTITHLSSFLKTYDNNRKN